MIVSIKMEMYRKKRFAFEKLALLHGWVQQFKASDEGMQLG